MSRHWKVRSSKELFSSGIFRLRSDECELPDGRIMPRYYVMEFPDWVNIIPVTTDGKIVMIEQYRHASGTMEWEVPGGSTDPHVNESALQAASRELLEETGYKPEKVVHIASHCPNPAMQANFMHTFIGYGCKKAQEPKLDPFEDISVTEKSVSEVYELIRSGQLRHTIVMASILLALPHLGFQIPVVQKLTVR